jgi:hypothetical protein
LGISAILVSTKPLKFRVFSLRFRIRPGEPIILIALPQGRAADVLAAAKTSADTTGEPENAAVGCKRLLVYSLAQLVGS